MKLGTVTKQPIERFSYTVNYTDALTIGDNVQTATVIVAPTGLTIDNVGVYDPRVKFWCSGGTNGVIYKLTITMNSADGRIFQDELYMKVKEV